MNEDLKKNLLNIEAFQRFAFMLLFVLVFMVVKLVVFAIAVFQLLHLLFTGSLHHELKNFAYSISIYVYDITKYLTFDSEELPFPFKAWPEQKVERKKDDKKESLEKKEDQDDEDEMHA